MTRRDFIAGFGCLLTAAGVGFGQLTVTKRRILGPPVKVLGGRLRLTFLGTVRAADGTFTAAFSY